MAAASTLPGYLTKEIVADSLALLPPPPGLASRAGTRRRNPQECGLLYGTHLAIGLQRWMPSGFPKSGDAFACTLGVSIDEQHTSGMSIG
jgi:hypothetical protein